MNDRELELIAALADGSLEDETEARALLDASAEARAEYEAQLLALQALGQVRAAHLSDSERAGLRRDIWTELRTPAKSPTPWYYRWAPAAASLFVLIGIVAILDQQTADDSSFRAATELSAASGEQGAGSDGDSAAIDPPNAGGVAEDSGPVTAYYSAVAETLREEPEDFLADEAAEPTSLTLSETCLDKAGLAGFSVAGSHDIDESRWTGPVPPIEQALILIRQSEDLTIGPIAFVDPETCEILHLDE